VAVRSVQEVEHLASKHAPVITVQPLRECSVAVIFAAHDGAHEALEADYLPQIRERITALSSRLDAIIYADYDAHALANVIDLQRLDGRELVIIVSISATIDREDTSPLAIRLAGGTEIYFGVPVDPGNLMLLGYVEDMPVMGAPSCIKSPKTNVIDLVLPRLLTGEHLTRSDLVAMGHGGLLEDIRERPMPRTASVTRTSDK
jgi:molybdenum cofactor cytidylyltransferase